MKRIELCSIIFILSISLASCGSNAAGQADHNQGAEKQQITAAIPNLPGSNSGIEAIAHSQQSVTKEIPIDVHGENTSFSFHSIDFIDENTGWVVKGAYRSERQETQLLRTEDGGRQWEEIGLDNMTLCRIKFVTKTTGWAIAQSESKSTSGTQQYTMKILCTMDSGKSWDVQWEMRADSGFCCQLWFADTTHGYALVSGVLLSTRDGGKLWTSVSFDVDGFTPQHMSFVDADKGWLIGEIEQKTSSLSSDQNKETKLIVLRTTDGGRHWQKQFERIYDYGPAGSIDINFVNTSTGWFLTSDSTTMNGDLYHTSNAGEDWEKINQIRSARPSPTELNFITAKLGWIPLNVGAGPISGGLMFTIDGGKSFNVINDYDGFISMHEADFISQQQGWAIGDSLSYGQYIIHTTDGGKIWIQVYPHIRPTEDISFVDNQHGFGLGQLSDSGALLFTPDGGETWENIHSFTESYNPSMISFINLDTGWVLAGKKESADLVILKSLNSGKTWITLEGDIPQIKVYSVVYVRFFDSDCGLLISKKADDTYLYRTQDGGKTWQMTEYKSKKGSINQFSFVSEKLGWETLGSDKAISLNKMKDGSTWELLKQIGTDTYSYGIDFISKDKGWMLIEEPAYKPGSLKKMMITADGGDTWFSYAFPKDFELETVQSRIPMQFTDDSHGWMLTSYGLLKTGDGGKSWTRLPLPGVIGEIQMR